ncbi:uncharacterized protein L969DRAFT_85146 [Mixia osmundae IAM 14324]|uniref:F-box domain-containing protein n=1 Tax=Mixia osmundae (strain CBS 9802 / IAM 14324 / JCM 22182 / KY 12970) TaxID=764103 RepID=G7DY08_MIXOS|nr:uncharacterized protein L969DRAFT_85146 [Mixia osmundae IAM 14324]KEI41368.1 hypothetical protein L969DRAFT_85146 [Mixia osmundae IAM 14324]GAA95468.1 hypothetical protein E5Q_02122 [Mixia osmundae IAM 14324]
MLRRLLLLTAGPDYVAHPALSRVPELPEDVLSLIFEELLTSGDIGTLHSCLFVDRSWGKLAAIHLYRHICLLYPVRTSQDGFSSSKGSRCQGLIRALRLRPERRRTVRSVAVNTRKASNRSHHTSWADLQELLAMLPNLQTIRGEGYLTVDATELMIWRQFAIIDSLDPRQINSTTLCMLDWRMPVGDPHLAAQRTEVLGYLLLRLPALRSLRIEGLLAGEHQANWPRPLSIPAPLDKLERLDLRSCVLTSSQFDFITGNAKDLRFASFEIVLLNGRRASPETCARQFAKLEALRIDGKPFTCC